MLNRVTAICEAKGYEDVVLVTGRAHLPGLIEASAGRDLQIERVYHLKWLRSGTIERMPEGDERPERDLASVGRRVGAGLVDVALLAGLVFAVVGLTVDVADRAPFLALVGWFIGLPFAYFATFEATFGATPGKLLLGLQVTDSDGNRPGVRAILVRNLLRPVDLLLVYLVAIRDERNRSIGDQSAGTEVRRG